MVLSTYEKNKIRTALTLELNSAFSNVSRHYKDHGTAEDREFLQTLIESIKGCIKGKDRSAEAADGHPD